MKANEIGKAERAMFLEWAMFRHIADMEGANGERARMALWWALQAIETACTASKQSEGIPTRKHLETHAREAATTFVERICWILNG